MALSKAAHPPAAVGIDHEGNALLDEVHEEFLEDRIDEAMPRLITGLADLRARSARGLWSVLVEGVCRPHPLLPLLHQDLFTQRAFTKPRGYPGDAVMLDYVYAAEDPGWLDDPAFTPLGAAVNRGLNQHPTVRAVRDRKHMVSRYIDHIAESTPQAHVFSVAAGHAREAGGSLALQERRLGRFLALDHDPVSLEVIQQDLGPLGAQTVCASVVDLVRGGLDLGDFDLIYSMGLFDYLRQGFAERLTAALFARLKPGGRLLIANFQPEAEGAGYMEAFMDWWLIHRSAEDLLALSAGLPEAEVHSRRAIYDDHNTVITLELVRAG